MEFQNWTAEDTLVLIEWCTYESLAAIKSEQYREAEVLQKGVSTIMGMGQMHAVNDSRLNKWIDFRLSEIRDSLREYRSLELATERSHTLKSIALLTRFIEGLPAVSRLSAAALAQSRQGSEPLRAAFT